MIAHRPLLAALLTALLSECASGLADQAVDVRLTLSTNVMPVGDTALVRVSARIATNEWANTDRIFSWSLNLLNATGTVAMIQAAQLTKPTSDNDPRTSSYGFVEGANVRGIYDTFMNYPSAGRSNWIELFSVPVKALAVGQTTFQVTPGTNVPGLSADFIVAPLGGGEPLLGGVYSRAAATLKVVSDPHGLRLGLTADKIAQQQYRVTITFTPRPDWNHYVQYLDQLGTGSWQTLPNGPHNSGSLTTTNSVSQRFYRVRLTL